MPGIDKIIRGILKYHATMKNDMLKQLKMAKDNPQVSFKACLYKFVVKGCCQGRKRRSCCSSPPAVFRLYTPTARAPGQDSASCIG